LAVDGKAPLPEVQPNGKRTFSIEEINAVRESSTATSQTGAISTSHAGEKLQVISVINFKGGQREDHDCCASISVSSLKRLPCSSNRPGPAGQASQPCSAISRKLDVLPNETLYGALRYDSQRISIEEIIRATYLPGLHFIPGNLELMEFETTTPVAKEVRTFFLRITEALQPVESEYDVVVMDCRPTLGISQWQHYPLQRRSL
jgi:chromosome partitioning protein